MKYKQWNQAASDPAAVVALEQAGLPAGRLVAVTAALEPGAGFDRAALEPAE